MGRRSALRSPCALQTVRRGLTDRGAGSISRASPRAGPTGSTIAVTTRPEGRDARHARSAAGPRRKSAPGRPRSALPGGGVEDTENVRWLIDGYNVIRREPDLRAREAESLEAGRRALLHLLASAPRDPRDEFTVVFDGARVGGGHPSPGRIRVIFSRPPHSADDELMHLARQWRSGAVVVTSDRRIQDAARRAGAAALTAEQFLEGLRPKGLS